MSLWGKNVTKMAFGDHRIRTHDHLCDKILGWAFLPLCLFLIVLDIFKALFFLPCPCMNTLGGILPHQTYSKYYSLQINAGF